MKLIKWFILAFLTVFALVWLTLAAHAASNMLEIDGQILYRDNVDYVSRIQQTPEYSLSTLKNDPCWYFFVYFKNPQSRSAAIISAKSKQQIDLYYSQVVDWIREK